LRGNHNYNMNPYKKQRTTMVFLSSPVVHKKQVVNPYKKKPKTFAVFNPNQQRTGMPDTKSHTKKKAEVIVHHCSQTGCGKGKIASTHNTNTIWQLPNNKVLVKSNNTGNKWKLLDGIPTSTVGKYELKKVLIELHLMGF
jgi:hypothetical protein